MNDARAGVERLPLLDGLRGLAALGVLFYHASAAFGGIVLFNRMYLLVDLFFMLSGFVLSLAAEPKIAAGLTARGFLKSRARRLWPMVALGATLGAMAILFNDPPLAEVLGVLTLSLLMIPMLSSSVAIFPLNGPQWSIMWELVANFVHAAWLQPLGERGLLAIAGMAAALLVIAVACSGWAGVGATAANWWLAPPRVAWAYVMGIWMARVWLREAPRCTAHWLIPLVLPVLVLAGLPYVPIARAAGDALFLIVILPPLFWVAVSARPPQTAMRPLAVLGALSFPLYAVHIPVLHAFRLASGESRYDLMAVGCAIAAAAIVAATSPILARTRAKRRVARIVAQAACA